MEQDEEAFEILGGKKSNPDRLDSIMPVEGVTPRSMAIFDDVLLVGTDDGRVFKASLFAGDDS